MRRLCWLLPSLLLGACFNDGQIGDNGLVRFSQVVNFVETNDFTAPIATGRTILVALQHPEDDLLGLEDTFTELTLRVEDSDNPGRDSSKASVFPLGFAQYGVVLNEEGAYLLVAESDGLLLDAIVVQAKQEAGLRLSNRIFLSTDGETCTELTEISSLDGFVLHPNQDLEVFVVPVDDTGAPMLGLLELSAEGSPELFLDSPLIGRGSLANALQIFPGDLFGTPVEFKIIEHATGTVLTTTLETSAEPAPVSCE